MAVNLEYYNGKEWIPAGGGFFQESLAWISLGGDDLNYRTVDADTGRVLTEKLFKPPVKAGVELIAEKRAVQISVYGFDKEHDRATSNSNGELAQAACYLLSLNSPYTSHATYPAAWDTRWIDRFLKRSKFDRLVTAGALIAAELDRLTDKGEV